MKAIYIVFALLTFAAGTQAQDWAGNFHGMAEIRLDNGESYHCAVVSRSLGPNEWKITFASDKLSYANRETWTTIGIHTGGKIVVIIADWGIMTITPADKAVREQLKRNVGAFDSRRQICRIANLEDGDSEMRITTVAAAP
jgi:hypothetical protein